VIRPRLLFFWSDEQFDKKVVQLLFDRHWFFLNVIRNDDAQFVAAELLSFSVKSVYAIDKEK
ncbi:hypothetical protein J0683_21535, partial [Vibrio parahaemolyticus]|uniref:hypothetical protein n=1 Tax=Vibrio parahaemolyticus TaxID=670 RepID=UPI001A8D05D6|nr:hypothetical protein [Vibrio parahaemolyticus]MDF4861186.1 hypothetical protein [Vibrio parahaemolyticus]